jgi:hypothetical protein
MHPSRGAKRADRNITIKTRCELPALWRLASATELKSYTRSIPNEGRPRICVPSRSFCASGLPITWRGLTNLPPLAKIPKFRWYARGFCWDPMRAAVTDAPLCRSQRRRRSCFASSGGISAETAVVEGVSPDLAAALHETESRNRLGRTENWPRPYQQGRA